MDNKKLELVANLLNEKLAISHMTCATAADMACYNGMIQIVYAMGYDIVIDKDEHHILIEQ